MPSLVDDLSLEPEEYATKNNLIQKDSSEELKPIIEKIISENPNVVAEYKTGKENALQFLMGQIMKETKGSANPMVVQELLKTLI